MSIAWSSKQHRKLNFKIGVARCLLRDHANLVFAGSLLHFAQYMGGLVRCTCGFTANIQNRDRICTLTQRNKMHGKQKLQYVHRFTFGESTWHQAEKGNKPNRNRNTHTHTKDGLRPTTDFYYSRRAGLVRILISGAKHHPPKTQIGNSLLRVSNS